jgi:transcriptional regulator
MFIPAPFHEQDEARLLSLMESFDFATLVSPAQGLPVASPLPFLVRRDEAGGLVLRAHMARANPQWRSFQPGVEVLVMFLGPHGYVSPSWYATAPNVPTWNYAAVHAYGPPRVIEDTGQVLQLLRESAARYEAGQERPWAPEQAEEYVHRLIAGIVAFEVRVTRLEGKFKLSQNRSEEDQRGVLEALEASTLPEDRRLAALMRERKTGA